MTFIIWQEKFCLKVMMILSYPLKVKKVVWMNSLNWFDDFINKIISIINEFIIIKIDKLIFLIQYLIFIILALINIINI